MPDKIDATERRLIDEWLTKNRPTECPPCTHALWSSVEGVHWKDQHKSVLKAAHRARRLRAAREREAGPSRGPVLTQEENTARLVELTRQRKQERLARARDAIARSGSLAEFARLMGITVAAARSYLDDHKLTPPWLNRLGSREDREANYARLCDGTRTAQEVADEMGIQRTSVTNYVRDKGRALGLKVKPPLVGASAHRKRRARSDPSDTTRSRSDGKSRCGSTPSDRSDRSDMPESVEEAHDA